LFKGEKPFFVGRKEYINEIIKEQIKVPASKVCIVGPGGSGKSQLAFKAIHQYEKEGIFDLVVPVYFSDVSSMSFSDFLSNIAKSLFDINYMQVFEKLDIEGRKKSIQNFLSQRRKHPLLFLDNYETISYIINDKIKNTNTTAATVEQYDQSINIGNFINNELPSNTSILVTSREKNNNFGNKERRIDLEGLQKQESIELFSGLTSEDFLKNQENIINNPTAKAAVDKIYEMTGGHPLSIEIIAKNTSSVFEIQEMSDTLGLGIVNIDEPNKRLRSLEACFDYTIKKLSDKIKNLLYCLTLFKSPFPIFVAKEIFDDEIKSITELYNRSLLLQIKSETSFGKIDNPEYWLYSTHPAIRNYLEKTMQNATGKTIDDLEDEYAYNFYRYYGNLLWDTYDSIGKDVHRSSMARFNLVYNQGSENNDFDRAITFAEYDDDLRFCVSNCKAIGNILRNIGLYSKARGYYNKALDFNRDLNNKDEMAKDYTNLGNVHHKMREFEQALDYHKKALDIDNELNDRVALAKDYTNLGNVHYDKGESEQALDYHKKALVIYKEINDRVGLAAYYRNLGNIYYDKGEFEQALDYHEQALVIYKEINDKARMAKEYYNMSFPLYAKNKESNEALQHLNIAKTILLDSQKQTGYSHPLLKEVEDRISFIEQKR